jgi:hypothetical protein
VLTKIFAVPVSSKQPLTLADVSRALIDIDEVHGFMTDLESGSYFLGLTNTALQIVGADNVVKLNAGDQALSPPVVRVDIKPGQIVSKDITVTSKSADAPPPRPFLGPVNAGGEGVAALPRTGSEAFPSHQSGEGLRWLALLVGSSLLAGAGAMGARRFAARSRP